jgi:hypothetical protein
MPGLDPGIDDDSHDRIMTASVAGSLVDCRFKPGNDGG